jgi:hypothetical protein
MNSIKSEFVYRELTQISKDIDKAQRAAIKKYLHFKTGRLMNDRVFEVLKGSYMSGEMTLEHPIYERFLDIKKKSKVLASGKSRKKNRPKSYPIHNRIIMGHFNRLIYQLLYGLTDEVKEQIRKDLDNQTIIL